MKLLLEIILTILAIALLYICFSFVKLTFDFTKWGEFLRYLFALLSLVIIGSVVIYKNDIGT